MGPRHPAVHGHGPHAGVLGNQDLLAEAGRTPRMPAVSHRTCGGVDQRVADDLLVDECSSLPTAQEPVTRRRAGR